MGDRSDPPVELVVGIGIVVVACAVWLMWLRHVAIRDARRAVAAARRGHRLQVEATRVVRPRPVPVAYYDEHPVTVAQLTRRLTTEGPPTATTACDGPSWQEVGQ